MFYCILISRFYWFKTWDQNIQDFKVSNFMERGAALTKQLVPDLSKDLVVSFSRIFLDFYTFSCGH